MAWLQRTTNKEIWKNSLPKDEMHSKDNHHHQPFRESWGGLFNRKGNSLSCAHDLVRKEGKSEFRAPAEARPCRPSSHQSPTCHPVP